MKILTLQPEFLCLTRLLNVDCMSCQESSWNLIIVDITKLYFQMLAKYYEEIQKRNKACSESFQRNLQQLTDLINDYNKKFNMQVDTVYQNIEDAEKLKVEIEQEIVQIEQKIKKQDTVARDYQKLASVEQKRSLDLANDEQVLNKIIMKLENRLRAETHGLQVEQHELKEIQAQKIKVPIDRHGVQFSLDHKDKLIISVKGLRYQLSYDKTNRRWIPGNNRDNSVNFAKAIQEFNITGNLKMLVATLRLM